MQKVCIWDYDDDGYIGPSIFDEGIEEFVNFGMTVMMVHRFSMRQLA